MDSKKPESLADLRGMTVSPEREPESEADEKPGGEGVKVEKKALGQTLKDAASLYIYISGFVALVVVLFSWTVLGTSYAVKASVTIGLFALLVVLTSGGRLKKARDLTQITALATSFGVLCICSTVVIMQSLKKQSPPPAHNVSSETAVIRGTTIRFVDRGTLANPLPAECVQQVAVSGHVPDGYGFAVGNLITGSTTDRAPVFVPDTAVVIRDGNIWNFTITFGDNDNAGDEFEAYLVVMPLQELSYLVTEGQITRQEEAQKLLTRVPLQNEIKEVVTESWWIATGLPPSPAFRVDTQFYQRSKSSGGC
jgi:hypothetical protein